RLDDAERLLRAAGCHLGDPRCVPGGGRWQREAAAALRRSADAAPGKAPEAVRAAAEAFDALADALARNAGFDPWRTPLLSDAGEVQDSWPCVRLALGAAFEAAGQVLRVDGVESKQPSSPARLRGPGPPTRVTAGDVPPLM
ncbi:MAG TPA: TCP-1/cpn60 chaperonin family protein, partial [Candidatus Thermoplasmatota archaeon]|nr:TCP-1/cpn60 chaperonin family protein [Candidatus Thermoplasmatota archaeon]